MSDPIRTIAVVGTGVIGASWAAHFLAHGLRVIATDPAKGARERLYTAVDAHWRWLYAHGRVPDSSYTGLDFDEDLKNAVSVAQFVQENGPEQLEVKQNLFRQMDAATSPRVILATSSSGLSVSAIQACCIHPQRVIIGHPVNPPHLLPLVEVIGGEAASVEMASKAMAFYAGIGKTPIHVLVEVKGHLVNRLQAALWQEMIHMVSTGIATAEQVDLAMRFAIGPRWAAQGPFVNLHLSGGVGGLRRVLESLGPAMQTWWEDLGQVKLTPSVIDRVVASAEHLIAGEQAEQLAARRDSAVARILEAAIEPQHVPGNANETSLLSEAEADLQYVIPDDRKL
jgi:carnitine 3-dehydrogenase